MSSRAAKRARIVEEPAYVTTDGEVKPYLPVEITKAREAYAASLDVLFKHVADFHVMIVQILADKYKLDEEEMLSAIKDDPRYTGMTSQPKLNPLGYFKAADAPTTTAAAPKAEDGGMFEESDAEMAAVTAKVAAIQIGPPVFANPESFTAKKKVAVRGRPKKPTGGAVGGASS